MSTLAVIATSTVAGVIGAAAMYIPARLARYDAATYREMAERKLDECEARDAAFEATRNKPWHYAAELPPVADHEGEVLHVEHPTGEIHRPTLDDLAEEVALVQALSDEPEHDDEDAPADDTQRPGMWWLVLLAVPVALWSQLVGWLRSLRSKPEPYRGRHWVEGTVHTGTWPIVIPAQRDGGDE